MRNLALSSKISAMEEHFNVLAASLHLREASNLLAATDFKTSTFLLELAKAILEDTEVPESEVSTALSTLEQIDPLNKDINNAQ